MDVRKQLEQWLACELRNGRWTRKVLTQWGTEIQETLSWDEIAKITIGILHPYINVTGELEKDIKGAQELTNKIVTELKKEMNHDQT